MKTAKIQKTQTNKKNYMSDEAFADLKEAMEDSIAFEQGKRRDLKITRIRLPQAPKTMSSREIVLI